MKRFLFNLFIGIVFSLPSFAQLRSPAPGITNIMPSNWAEMQAQAAAEHRCFQWGPCGNGGRSNGGNNDAVAGVILGGVILGIIANRLHEERMEEERAEREYRMEEERRRIINSPYSTVQRTHIPQCINRVVADQHGRLFQERICL